MFPPELYGALLGTAVGFSIIVIRLWRAGVR
jgi:hypothetical protein